MPDADLALKTRAPFSRHTLYGLNAFLGAFFEQFPLELDYQATPPYFLAQRFEGAARGPLKDDTARLYYLAAHLNTEARAEDGTRYLEGWKLQLAQESETLGPA